MVSRTRFIAGVISGAAFLFLFGWGVRASMCAAEMEMPGSEVMHAAHAGTPDDPMAGDGCADLHDPEGGTLHCPLLLTGSSCQTAVSLPAMGAALTASTGTAAPARLAVRDSPLLLSSRPFHPPRA